ncbi:MAG: hypothetical protein NTZ17_17815 [Phycisphaerae bacterium]|nr:hypothetical protein [Phycisphaerae bacterium]
MPIAPAHIDDLHAAWRQGAEDALSATVFLLGDDIHVRHVLERLLAFAESPDLFANDDDPLQRFDVLERLYEARYGPPAQRPQSLIDGHRKAMAVARAGRRHSG